MNRYRKPIVSVLLVLATVVLMGLTARERERVTLLEQQIVELLAPVQAVFSRAAQRARETAADLAELAQVRVENERLRGRLELVPWLEQELAQVRAENARMRRLLGFAETQPFAFIAARVIARNPDNWFSYAVLDKGAADGVSRDMAVVTYGGLVGRVVRVGQRTCTVLFILDRDSGVAVGVYRGEASGETATQVPVPQLESFGVVLGHGAQRPLLHLRIFSPDAAVKPGDSVLTSGLGGVFPAGLYVGRVEEVGWGEMGLVKWATVRPAVDFDRLSEVLIVTGAR